MKKLSLILVLASFSLAVSAQEGPDAIKAKIEALTKQKSDLEGQITTLTGQLPIPPIPLWKYVGNINVNLGQAVLGDWAAGGFSNFNLGAVGHVEANMTKGRHEWKNGFDGNLGFVKNFDAVNGGTFPIAKASDMLQLNSKYLYDLKKSNLKAAFNVNFLSQFIKTWDTKDDTKLISDFLAPGVLDLSPGLEWTPKPFFSLFFTPASGRMTFVTNDTIINRSDAGANRFGNDLGQKMRPELGAKIDAVFNKELFKNFGIRSRLQLFNAWSRPQNQIDAIHSSRANIDVNWQNDLYYKMTKNMTINFGFQTIRDDDQKFSNVDKPDLDGKKAIFQLRQYFGIGIGFGF